MFKPPYISIVSIAANKELMPEFMQNNVNGEVLSAAILERLEDANLRAAESKALFEQTAKMSQNENGHKKSGLASDQAASKLLAFLNA